MGIEALHLERRAPLTVDEFFELAKQEGWDEDTRVELLDGEVVWMSPIGNPHAGCINRLNQFFRRYPEQVALVAVQNPVWLGEHDFPQPDVMLLAPRPDFYATATPTPADVRLLVEVADTTLRTDLGRKARIYAAAGVPEYWVVDLNNATLYVHRAPVGATYQERILLQGGESVSAQFAPDIHFSVGEILGQ